MLRRAGILIAMYSVCSIAPAESGQWREFVPEVRAVLANHSGSCQPETLRGDPVETAEFASESVALIDVCPLGAYTELIDAMLLRDSHPVLAHFRKDGHQLDIGFSRGASAMHGTDVKLVQEKQAIYDISWDNNGLDDEGKSKLQKCELSAYVWNPMTQTFDFNRSLSGQARSKYCQDLAKKTH